MNRRLSFSNLATALITGLLFAGCASQPKLTNRGQQVLSKYSNQKVFYAPFDLVWRAAQLSVKYPIAMNNMDNGYLETEPIKSMDGFNPPGVPPVTSSGISYRINLTLVKGKVNGREGVRVTVNKTIERKRDYFSDPEPIESDGLEEKVIIYRMERELIIDEAIKKEQAKSSS